MNVRMKVQLWHSAIQILVNIIYPLSITNSSQTCRRGRACPPAKGMVPPNLIMTLPRWCTSITKHLVDHNPHVTDGPPSQDCPTYTRSQMINTISLPLYTNCMWRSATCTWSMIRKILQFRTNTYFTAARAFIIKRAYVIATGRHKKDTCPLCHAASPIVAPPRDTVGHLLGACCHPAMKACYIARHNQAVHLIFKAISSGSQMRGGWFAIMDATRRNALPREVHDTRIPPWMLPSLDNETRNLLRPDILIIQNLKYSDFLRTYQHLLESPIADTRNRTLAALQSHCLVHIIEVGYTSDASHRDSLQRKRVQHNCLINHLLDAGWRIHTTTATAPPTNVSQDQRSPDILSPSLAVPQTPAADTTLPERTADPSPDIPVQEHPTPCLWCGTVHPDYSHHVHIVLLSTTGIIYKPILPLLEFF